MYELKQCHKGTICNNFTSWFFAFSYLKQLASMPDFLLENKRTQTHLNNPLIKDLFVNTGSNVVILARL